MFNLAMGAIEQRGGRSVLRTSTGRLGHAIYGPYEDLTAGTYVASFEIALAEAPDSDDLLCGFVDVVANSGNDSVAFEPLFTSQLGGDLTTITLDFELREAKQVEYRIQVNGQVPLLIADTASSRPAETERWSRSGPRNAFVAEHLPMLERISGMGARIAAIDGGFIMELDGVRFNARTYDDVNFVHELFVLNAYNVLSSRPTCMIDIGMNVALASLQFAKKDFVKEIHAFEPFAKTYERGMANIALNPDLAPKIKANNFGLGDVEGDITIKIHDGGDSGAMTTRDSENGTPMTIPMRETSSALGPIIESARERGLEVLIKVDCEGSEFVVFDSLKRSGLLSEVRGFMVEWHRMFEGRDQHELTVPLLANGYLVFDVSPPTGNGFFYATRFA